MTFTKRHAGIALLILAVMAPSALAVDFQDVSSANINADAIQYLQDNKIVEGYSDDTYKPANRINRAEFVKILVASQVKSPTGSNCFTDVKKEWFAPYVCTAKKLGYISGYSDGSFQPGQYINFAEASKIVTKAYKVKAETAGTNNEWFAGYVKGLEVKNAIPSTVQFFDKPLTRGEMAEMVWRLKAGVTDKVSSTYDEITSEFPTIASCDALKEKFSEYQGRYTPSYYGDDVMMEERADDVSKSAIPPMAAPATTGGDFSAGSGAGGALDHSETNVQVRGVDEADIVKNDGQYIYTVKNNTVRIVQATPAGSMKQTASLDFSEKDSSFYPSEMYIAGSKLVVIGQSWQAYGISPLKSLIARPYPYTGSRTRVYIFNVADHAKPTVERVVSYEGNYQTSRRIDDKLYMVLNDQPNVWTWADVRGGADLVPRIQDGEKPAEAAVDCAQIRYFPGYELPSYLIISGIDLSDAESDISREVVLGSSENVFASETHLYVANMRTPYNLYADWNWNTDMTKTLVYKFALENGKPRFVARGEVPGQILNQFSMDAYKDHFRIATTRGSTWDDSNPSGNNVYVLDSDMKMTGKLEGLAKGERIYSTRFLGDRLYMVTFKQVDPLFVVDMSDATAPKVLGELKIPGFSNYIHPYDATHILGFGQDTQTNDWGGTVTAGMKVALFDVADVAHPVQQYEVKIGDQGTYSELLYNHKVLLFDKAKNLLAFPIQIVEKKAKDETMCSKYRYSTCPNYCQPRCIPTNCTLQPDGSAQCTNDCEGLGSCTDWGYDQYVTTFRGAMVYSLDLQNGFKEKGRITHDKADEKNFYDYERVVQRMLYIGNNLYTVSAAMIKANLLSTLDAVGTLELN